MRLKEVLISKFIYHKEMNDTQGNKIKFLFETKKKVGRSSFNPRRWILKSGTPFQKIFECMSTKIKDFGKF